MKNNLFKYIFISVVIILIGFAIYQIYNEKQEEKEKLLLPQIQKQEEKIITDIRIPISNFDTINPIISKNQNVQDISRLVYEPLLNVNENYKIELCLAKEWSKISDTSYLIKLNENIKWHDDIQFEAKDVQFTIDKIKNEVQDSIYAWNLEKVNSVEVIDKYTIRINLSQEVPFFEYNLTFPILASHYYVNEEFRTSSKNNNPVGTGRYKVIENVDNNLKLKKNDTWWDKENKDCKLELITVNKYANMGEVYNAFKIGNIDLLTTQSIDIDTNIGTIGFQSKSYSGRKLDFIAINTTNSILQNKEVRQAIQYAIDKQNIVSNVYKGKYAVSNFVLDYGNYLYNPEKIHYEYNIEKAKQVLIDNGWEYKSKQWQKVQDYRTKRININLVVKSSDASRVSVAEIIKTQLENIGFKINLIKATDSQYANYLKNKNYDLILTGVYLPYSPNLTTYFGQNNLALFQDDELINLINEVKNIAKEETMKEKYTRIEEIYQDELPYIFLYNSKETLIYANNLIGNINPFSYNIYNNIETWYRK